SAIAREHTTHILYLHKPHPNQSLRDVNSQAKQVSKEMPDQRGNTRRNYRNTLVFLAADRNRLEDLRQGVRQYLAWDSINQESETLNLDAYQRSQARTKRDEANKSVDARIPETHTSLIAPEQSDPRQPDHLEHF